MISPVHNIIILFKQHAWFFLNQNEEKFEDAKRRRTINTMTTIKITK
jgi:hypothetical protein